MNICSSRTLIPSSWTVPLIIGLCAGSPGHAASAPAGAAQPSARLVNDWLRTTFPAASAWDVGGELRLRYEVKENAGFASNRDFLKGLDNSNDYWLTRLKTRLGYQPSDWFSGFAEGRDAHAHSDQRANDPETDRFDLYQAFVKVGNPKEFPLTLTLGRQEMAYGDERFVGKSSWSNTGRSFDAARLAYASDPLRVDAFTGRVVIPRDNHFDIANDYDWFSGLHAFAPRLISWQDTQFFFIARNVGSGSPNAVAPGVGGPGPRDIYTIGTRWESNPGALGAWNYTFGVAGQFGSINAGGRRLDHEAFALDFTIGHTWREAFGSPRLHVGYDCGSGDSNPADGRNQTFELLLGTNHRLYGLMDVMGLRNMHIPRFGGAIQPLKNLTLSLEWLGFLLADTSDFFYPETGAGRSQNGYGRNPGFSSHVGHELDLLLTWRAASWANVQAGYGHFFAGDYIRQSARAGGRSAEDADWLYLQATFSF